MPSSTPTSLGDARKRVPSRSRPIFQLLTVQSSTQDPAKPYVQVYLRTAEEMTPGKMSLVTSRVANEIFPHVYHARSASPFARHTSHTERCSASPPVSVLPPAPAQVGRVFNSPLSRWFHSASFVDEDASVPEEWSSCSCASVARAHYLHTLWKERLLGKLSPA